MKSSTQLSKINFSVVFLLIFFLGCGKEPEKKEFAVRVNDSYLTEEDILELDTLSNQSFSRNEIIKRWVEKELLYQQALNEGITNEDEFKRIINNSGRELASSMLIKKYLDENLIKPGIKELQDFYEKFKYEFVADENIYVFHIAVFNSENPAIQFRKKVFEDAWEKAIQLRLDDNALIQHSENKTLTKEEIYPIQLLDLIDELNPGEVSIILEEKPQRYLLVQLNQVVKKGTVPPLELVKEQVETRYASDKREEIINKYLEELYSESLIEIREK
jgi:hypothetical protein